MHESHFVAAKPKWCSDAFSDETARRLLSRDQTGLMPALSALSQNADHIRTLGEELLIEPLRHANNLATLLAAVFDKDLAEVRSSRRTAVWPFLGVVLAPYRNKKGRLLTLRSLSGATGCPQSRDTSAEPLLCRCAPERSAARLR